MTKTSVTAVTLSVIVTGISAWHWINQRQLLAEAVRAQAADTQRTQSAAQMRIKFEQDAAEAERKAATLLAAQQRLRDEAVKSAPPPKPSAPAAKTGSSPDVSNIVAKEPRIRALFEKSFRAAYAQTYGDTLQGLGVAPELREKAYGLLFNHEQDDLDLNWTARAQGLRMTDPAIQEMRRRNREELRAGLEATLGPTAAQAVHTMKRAEPARDFVMGQAQTLALAGEPLSPVQIRGLTQIIAEATPGFDKGGQADPFGANWDVVMAKVPSLLTARQLAEFRRGGEQFARVAALLPAFFTEEKGPQTGK